MPEPVTPNRPPSLLEFVKLNQPLNPHMTVPEIARVWNKDWGPVDPKTLPSLDTFLQKNKPLNPHMTDADLASHWHDYYGSLGADAGGKARPITTRKDRLMGHLNTDEAPGPLILPEDPEDLLEIDPIAHLERMLDAGVPFDVIDRRMDAFFGRASGNTAPSTPRRPKPKARNTPPTDDRSLEAFLAAARPLNPHKSTRELSRFWNEQYGRVDPKTLPSLETFLAAAKEDNPDKSDHELTSYWGDRYGALGAPEKTSVAPPPGLLNPAKDVGLKAAAGVLDVAKDVRRQVAAATAVPKMTGQPTTTQPRR